MGLTLELVFALIIIRLIISVLNGKKKLNILTLAFGLSLWQIAVYLRSFSETYYLIYLICKAKE